MAITINGTTGIAGVDGSAATPALQGTDTNTGIAFGSDVIIGSTGGVERWRTDSSGRVLMGTTSATANGGVLQVSNGITFPATQSACSDANTLDDYEEGTWTPSFNVNGSTAGVTYFNRYGFYTKIGNVVTIWGGFRLSNNGSSTGTVTITGIPFTPTDIASFQHPGQGGLITVYKANGTVWAISIDAAGLFFRSLTATNADTPPTDADFDDDTAILFTVTYKA